MKLGRQLKKISHRILDAANLLELARVGFRSEQVQPVAIPSWYRPTAGAALSSKLQSKVPLFLFCPWIPEHGDKLLGTLMGQQGYELAEFDAFLGIEKLNTRRSVARFARTNPAQYRRMILRRLIPLRKEIKGFIFTFDWAPAMRIIAQVCQELEIPTILIPHESVFVDREKYYWCSESNASVPVSDVVLGWGNLQKEIMVERGYDPHRFKVVGAPKFDAYHNIAPDLAREQFCRIFGLVPEKKIALFATQPLDSQLDVDTARVAQREAITDLLDYAEKHDLQMIVRLPPSNDDILGQDIRERIENAEYAAVDDASAYVLSAEEAIVQSDIVTSINSTMLFEGMLAGRLSFSMKYVDFEPFWQRAGIPSVSNKHELETFLNRFLHSEQLPESDGLAWAALAFGVGSFDGAAVQRISEYLRSIGQNQSVIDIGMSPKEKLFNKKPLDVVAIPSTRTVFNTVQRHIKPLLMARHVQSSRDVEASKLAAADLFFQWGVRDNEMRQRLRAQARQLGRPVIIVEDGFLRSVDIGLSGEPGLSVILDDVTAYYDATKVSRLERRLQEGPDLSTEEALRARQAIEKIVSARVSKYNAAPDFRLSVGRGESSKVLVVDQRFGDQSVESGMGSEESFILALKAALDENPNSDVIVKQHPDAINAGKSSYYSDERLADFMKTGRVFPVRTDINPYALFDLVDDVYVVTSGMGFEALMAGKRVHCFGMPFYAGWGLTEDHISLPGRRTRKRALEDVFHFSYIESSRYYDPEKKSVVEVEEIVDFLQETRNNELINI
ncbi:hypothetical protein [Labrenzia sp. CE80]|uniref:capsular polysaccharide export protein, LipB/KpsS family n=1 Tax=Labrenzia sp. CE80 TaxID=1788986 RepID=UPI00129A5DF5|nr:hypothetical protein [Labrenzia sp. CE80]